MAAAANPLTSSLDIAANWASIAGLLLSAVGLTITYLQARGAQSAAKKAKDAVDRVGQQVAAIDAVERLATCIRVIEEIKRHARLNEWDRVPELCGPARRPLVEIGAAGRGLSETHRSVITAAVTELRHLEDTVTKHIAGIPVKLDAPRIQRSLTELQDSLTTTLAQRRSGEMEQQ
jgi:hypothetical protein